MTNLIMVFKRKNNIYIFIMDLQEKLIYATIMNEKIMKNILHLIWILI